MMEMPLAGLKQVASNNGRSYDVVTLDRDADDTIHLRFLVRSRAGQWQSREVAIEPDVAEELLIMLNRELVN
jgi:hypothetical protein